MTTLLILAYNEEKTIGILIEELFKEFDSLENMAARGHGQFLISPLAYRKTF